MATNWQSLFPQGRTMAQPEPEGGYKPITELLAKPFTSIAQSQRTQGQPDGQGTVLLEPGQSPFAPSLPAPQNQQAGDISLMRPQQVQDQTELGPLSMELPVVNQAGAAFMEGVTLPQAGAGTVLSPAPTPSEQFSAAGIPQQPFDPSFLSQGQQAPTPTAQAPTTGPTIAGQPLGEFLAGGIQLDPQGRMVDPGVDRSEYEQFSAERSAAAGPNLTSIAGQPRPGVDVPSLAMQRERMAAGLDPVAGAPVGTGMSQQQQRDYLAGGRDPATGEKIATDDMTDYQKATLAQRQQQFEATQANINREWEAGQAALAEEKAQGIAETQESIQKETDRLNSQLGFLEGAAMEMAGLSNWTTEGIIGAGVGKLPFETNKKQVDRIANSFMGNAFLRSIIDSKSLGATFGALSNQEGEKITGAETILMDGSMSNERRLRAAADIISTIKSAKTRAEQRMAKTQGSVQSAPSASAGSATPQMEGFTFTRKN